MSNGTKKIVFLITPIGPHDSPDRNRVDQWMKLVYKKVFPSSEYKIVRSDQISIPGNITEQIIVNILDADIAIIDFTGLNPNVMYEAAIRHAIRKPYLQIAPNGQGLPFDVQVLRTIQYDSTDLQYTKTLVKKLKEAKKDIEEEGFKVPKIIPYKFDWDQVLSNPKAFAEALGDVLAQRIVNDRSISSKHGIERMPSFWEKPSLTYSLGKELVCPNCKTTDVDYKCVDSNSSRGVVTVYSKNDVTYRCNVCHTQFKG